MTLPSSLQGQPHPLPSDLRKDLPDYWIPWKVSDGLFEQMRSQKGKYKKIEILPTDPEWRFVWRYFYHDKPYKYGIQHIYCIHERHQQHTFELNLSSIEREVEKFPPTWNNEPRAKQRAQAIQRWKEATDPFSPFNTVESDGRKRNWKETKLIPLWHGTSGAVADSIAESGFVYFGKTTLGGSSSKDPTSTDEGFFGSGIYFTNSARYASDIYAKGHLLLSWVSMREPFPVVGDPQQQDMKTLQGKGAYKHYNAHYVPVISIDPLDPYEAVYHPAEEGIIPHCDEIVIFYKSQALPRFWIELQVEAPYKMNPFDIPQFVNEMIPHLFKILENPQVDRDQKLRNYLGQELGILLKLKGDDYLEDHGDSYETLYKNLTQLIEENGKINRNISRLLVGLPPSSSTPSLTTQQQQTQVQTPAENPTFSSFILNIFSNIFQPTAQNSEKAKVDPLLSSNSNPCLTTEVQKLQAQPTTQNITPLSFQSNPPPTNPKAASSKVTSSPSTTIQKQQTQAQTPAQSPMFSSFLSTIQNSEVNSIPPTKPMSPSSMPFEKAKVEPLLPSSSNPSLTTEVQKLQAQPTTQNITPLSFQSSPPPTNPKVASSKVTSSPSTTTQKQQTQAQTPAQSPMFSSFLSTIQNSEVDSTHTIKPFAKEIFIPSVAFGTSKWEKYFGDSVCRLIFFQRFSCLVVWDPLRSNPNPSLETKIQQLQMQSIPQNVTPLSLQSTTPAAAPTKLTVSSPKITSNPPIKPTSKAMFVPSMAFGKAKWKKYFGDIGVEPPLSPNVEEILNSPCPFWSEKKVRNTHLLVLVPKKVNGRPFHLDNLGELIKSPKKGHKTQYSYYNDYVKKDLGTKSLHSHWVLITKDVIPGSIGKSYEDQKALVQKYAKSSKIAYKLPTVLEITTAILMYYVEKGEKIYIDDYPYTHCQEVASHMPVSVGGFSSKGLRIRAAHCFGSFGHGIPAASHYGVGAMCCV